MSGLLIAPPLMALAAGVLAWFAGPRWARHAMVFGALAHLVCALLLFVEVAAGSTLAYCFGAWKAPLGIAFVADAFSASLVLLTALLGAAALSQSARFSTAEEHGAGAAPLALFLLAGVDAAFLTADLFHLYVAFELLLLASFALLVVCGPRAEAGERRAAAVRYLVPGVLSSMLLLAGVGCVYGLTGTLHMPDVAARIAAASRPPAVPAVAGLLALAFALKAAVFPVFAWLPASYPAATSALAALFSGLLSKVGVYALVRVFTLIFPGEMDWLGPVFLILAGATMLAGVLGALAQWDMQRLLCFHVVSQVGYLVAGFALGSAAGLASTVFYVFHNSVAKGCLLLATGVVRARRGTDRLRELGGLATSDPWLASAFFIAALALAGMPPLSGFWGKLLVLRALVAGEAWVLLAVAAGVGLLTLLSMTKIWTYAFWGAVPKGADVGVGAGPGRAGRAFEMAPVAILALVALGLGLGAGPALEFAHRAAAEVLEPTGYVEALRRAMP